MLIYMKAVRLGTQGGLEHLVIDDISEAEAPGHGQIRVRLQASSLNYHDYGVASNPNVRTPGRILLSDGAGMVEAVGDSVKEFAVGDLVVSCFFPLWHDGPPRVSDFLTVPGDGIDGYAREVVVAPAHAFTKAPRAYSALEAATLTTAGLTAWRALVVEGQLKAGETVLTLGTGGVSIFALQFAKHMGARVIVTSSSDEKLARARQLGADDTINYHETPNWGERVMEITHGQGADHIIEIGGSGTLPQSIEAVKIGGHIALIGILAGMGGDVPTRKLMTKQARLQGLIVGSRREQQEMITALEVTGMRPIIDTTFPLEQLADAFRLQASGGHFGKIGITIS